MKFIARAMWGLLAGIVLVVAVAAFVAPESTSVTSNADDIEWRKLDVPTTTTRAPHTTTTSPTVRPATDGEDVFIVIDGTRAFRIPRNEMTTKWLWLATAIEVK